MNSKKVEEENEKCKFCKRTLYILEGQICLSCFVQLNPDNFLSDFLTNEKFLPPVLEGGINLAINSFFDESTITKSQELPAIIDSLHEMLKVMIDLSEDDNIDNIQNQKIREQFFPFKQLQKLKEPLTSQQKRAFTSIVQKSVNRHLENDENYPIIQPIMKESNDIILNKINNGTNLSKFKNELKEYSENLLSSWNHFKSYLYMVTNNSEEMVDNN
jgi:hypothetical protein